jgi:hypothetical protein
MVSQPKKPERSNMPAPSMAPYEVQRTQQHARDLLSIFQSLFDATKGAFSPGLDDPKTWYGRIFRFIGLVCVYVVIAAILAVAIQNALSGRH